MPIGRIGSKINVRTGVVLESIVEPACRAAGLSVKAAHEIERTGLITTQVINHLQWDRIVLADLTGHNVNVFYELAIRHAFRRDVVMMIDVRSSLPFDLASFRAVLIDHRTPEGRRRSRRGLVAALRQCQVAGNPREDPVSLALDSVVLTHGRADWRDLQRALRSIRMLHRKIDALERTIDQLVAIDASRAPLRGRRAVHQVAAPVTDGRDFTRELTGHRRRKAERT